MVDPEELAKYDCATPTTLDYLADYDDAVFPTELFLKSADGVNASSHPDMYAVADVDDEPDNTHGQYYGTRQQSWISYPNNVLAYDMNPPRRHGLLPQAARIVEDQEHICARCE
ncbi:MAG: hypothetical protein ACKPKO_50595, partial [Candidatus Fonsibacter sp.]